MLAKWVTIGQVMMFVALVAVSLAIVRAAPWEEVVIYPPFWVVLGCLDFVIVWKLILNRPLRAYHYTVLVFFVVPFFAMANFVATERFHPLGFVIRCYQYLRGEDANTTSLGFLPIGEFWMACMMSYVFADPVGRIAARFEKRRGWDIAAFFRGALAGFGIANLLAIIEGAIWGFGEFSSIRLIANMVLLSVCVIVGGVTGLSKLKSTTLATASPDPASRS
jgi:hypothetical protein